jgi:excisionase family DNA binding protein
MDYMTIQEAAEKWKLSVRRVQAICVEGKISGTMKFGRSWAIPKDAEKPVDNRIKSGKYIKKEKTND